LETSCTEAFQLFNEFEQTLDVNNTHRIEIRRLVERISAGHGRFHIQLKVESLLSQANVNYADAINRDDEAFTLGTATTSQTCRVMVTTSWLLRVLASIRKDENRMMTIGQQQKIILTDEELGAETVVAIKTALGHQCCKRTRPEGPDKTPLQFQQFKASLPPQRHTATWAVSCIEMNWNYARTGVRYRFMEICQAEGRVNALTTALDTLAPMHHAMLRESPALFITPTTYDHDRVHDCPFVLWLKPVAERPCKRPRSPHVERASQAASWSSSSWAWQGWSSG